MPNFLFLILQCTYMQILFQVHFTPVSLKETASWKASTHTIGVDDDKNDGNDNDDGGGEGDGDSNI